MIKHDFERNQTIEAITPGSLGSGIKLIDHSLYIYNPSKSLKKKNKSVYQLVKFGENDLTLRAHKDLYRMLSDSIINSNTIDAEDSIQSILSKNDSIYYIYFDISCEGCIDKVMNHILKNNPKNSKLVLTSNSQPNPFRFLMSHKALHLKSNVIFWEEGSLVNSPQSAYPVLITKDKHTGQVAKTEITPQFMFD